MNLIKQDVKFGTKHTHHDNSITVIQLSPEQTEKLRSGVAYESLLTGQEDIRVEQYVRQDINVWKTPLSQIDISFKRYQELRLDMNDKEITRKLNISPNTLTKLKRQWGLID